MILAGVSTAYLIVTGLNTGAASIGNVLLTLFLGTVKFVGCILIMRWLMKRLCGRHDGIGKIELRRFGAMVAFLSALTFAAATMAWYQWNPEIVSQSMEQVMETMSRSLTADQQAAIEAALGHFPAMAFWTTLTYCFLYGWILSGILASVIAPVTSPFEAAGEAKEKDNGQETDDEVEEEADEEDDADAAKDEENDESRN